MFESEIHVEVFVIISLLFRLFRYLQKMSYPTLPRVAIKKCCKNYRQLIEKIIQNLNGLAFSLKIWISKNS